MSNELQITRHDQGHYYFKYTGGGELPDFLKGSFTSYKEAVIRLKRHYAIVAAKVMGTKKRNTRKENGEGYSTSKSV